MLPATGMMMTTVRYLVVVRLIGMITKIPDIAHRTRAKRLTTCCGTSTRRLSTKIRKTCINKEIYISTEGYYKTNPYWYKKTKRRLFIYFHLRICSRPFIVFKNQWNSFICIFNWIKFLMNLINYLRRYLCNYGYNKCHWCNLSGKKCSSLFAKTEVNMDISHQYYFFTWLRLLTKLIAIICATFMFYYYIDPSKNILKLLSSVLNRAPLETNLINILKKKVWGNKKKADILPSQSSLKLTTTWSLEVFLEIIIQPGVTIEVSQKIKVNVKNTMASFVPVFLSIVTIYKYIN